MNTNLYRKSVSITLYGKKNIIKDFETGEYPELFRWTLYLFPVVAVSNCHKIGNLKQQKFIPL